MSYYNLVEAYGNISLVKHKDRVKKPFYVRIPKTGGSLIERLFKKYKVGVYTPIEKWVEMHTKKISNCNLWHRIPSDYKRMDFSKLLVFASIRDPIEKLLSQYMGEEQEINEWIMENLKNNSEQVCYRDNRFMPQNNYLFDNFGHIIPNENIILCDENFLSNIKKFAERNGLEIDDCEKVDRVEYNELFEQLKPETIDYIKNYYSEDFKLIANVKAFYTY